MFCPRAFNLYTIITPVLERIAGVRYVGNSDLILGKIMHDKKKQTCFNFLVQHAQLAIWSTRRNLENNRPEQNAEQMFRKISLMLRLLSRDKFYQIFGHITGPSGSVMGFQLRL
jgi:hypothetical protein